MIPLADPALGDDELARIAEVFESGRLARGPEVATFQEEFAAFCEASRGVATSSGTTALHAALHALDLGSGDRVATSPFSFVASANAILWSGAEPTFVDVREDTYVIDLDALEARLRAGERIDGVLAVHTFGLPCDVARLRELAETYGFLVVEDAAQAHGATFDGTPVGSFGDVACFSFFATKNVTTGEGGMLVTDDRTVAERARSFVEHGVTEDGRYDGLGHNFCMSEVAAAIGRVQLEKLPELNATRRSNARRFSAELDEVPVRAPAEPPDRHHVYHQYTIQSEERDGLRSHLGERGVQCGTYYDTPIHRQPAYADLDATLPTADALAGRVLSIPVHPGLSEDEREWIVSSVADYFERTA